MLRRFRDAAALPIADATAGRRRLRENGIAAALPADDDAAPVPDRRDMEAARSAAGS